MKASQKVLGFWDNSIWIVCCKISLLRQEYLSSSVNVLKSNPKILDLSKREFFELNLSQNEDKIGSKRCREKFSSVWDS